MSSRSACTSARHIAATRLVLLTVLPGLLSSQPAAGDLFDQLYADGQKKNGTLQTLTASFTETTTSSLLTRPLVSRGTVAVERPSRVALRYTEPDERLVLIADGQMTFAWPSRGVRQVKDIGAAQGRVQKYFVDSSPEELRRHFEITAVPSEEHGGGFLVTLVPKRKQIQEGLTRLELWIDRTSLLMAAMRMTFPNGDTKLLTFSDVKPNPPLGPSAFREGRTDRPLP